MIIVRLAHYLLWSDKSPPNWPKKSFYFAQNFVDQQTVQEWLGWVIVSDPCGTSLGG